MPRIIKKILVVFVAVLLAVQVPFIYRRWKIGRIAGKIAAANAVRVVEEHPQYKEYKGIIHAHTSLGGHSTGGFDELIAAANSNDLDFVLMTEHYSDEYDTSALTLNGIYGKTLFVGGNEIDTANGDRFLMVPGSADAASLQKMSTNAVLEKLHAEQRLAIIAYPEKFKSWDSQFDGDEVINLHTGSKQMNPFTALGDLVWSYPAYPKLTLATHLRRPDANLQKFDEIAAKRNIMLTAGTDAHSNIGFHLFGDDAGNKVVNIKIDPYAATFGVVRMHVLVEKEKPLTRETLLEALKDGHTFIGFDVLGDTSGFSFGPCDADALCAETPSPARIVLLKDGAVLQEASGGRIKYGPYGPGVYRVEAYRDDLGPPFDTMPWILSNPIYVRQANESQ